MPNPYFSISYTLMNHTGGDLSIHDSLERQGLQSILDRLAPNPQARVDLRINLRPTDEFLRAYMEQNKAIVVTPPDALKQLGKAPVTASAPAAPDGRNTTLEEEFWSRMVDQLLLSLSVELQYLTAYQSKIRTISIVYASCSELAPAHQKLRLDYLFPSTKPPRFDLSNTDLGSKLYGHKKPLALFDNMDDYVRSICADWVWLQENLALATSWRYPAEVISKINTFISFMIGNSSWDTTNAYHQLVAYCFDKK